MASLAGKAVALEVLAEVGKGRLPNREAIARKHGYSATSARQGKHLSNKGYTETIEKFVNRVEGERSRLLLELTKRDISTERYSTIIEAIDKLTKVSQLLLGKSTENIATQVSIVNYSDTTPLTDVSIKKDDPKESSDE